MEDKSELCLVQNDIKGIYALITDLKDCMTAAEVKFCIQEEKTINVAFQRLEAQGKSIKRNKGTLEKLTEEYESLCKAKLDQQAIIDKLAYNDF